MRATAIRPSILSSVANGIGAVSRHAMGRKDIIPLWFGETDLVTPQFIRDAAKTALDAGQTFYTPARGQIRLRQGIRDWMERTAGATIELDRITVPGSAMMGIMIALQCLIDHGDDIIVVAPVWPNIFQAAETAGAAVRFVDLALADGRWSLDLAAVRSAIGPRTKAVFVATPGNPTGWVMSAAEQQALLDLAREHRIAVIADEVYGPLVYDGRHAPSFATIATGEDDVFIVHSFSKAWAMTGWRIGWLVHPLRLAEPMISLAAHNNTGSTSFAQAGAIAAITEGDHVVADMVARCRAGREMMAEFVKRHLRLDWAVPDAAFYAFIQIDGLRDSTAFCIDVLDRVKVGLAPGSAFGPDPLNDSRVRLCFAQSPDLLATALDRLETVL